MAVLPKVETSPLCLVRDAGYLHSQLLNHTGYSEQNIPYYHRHHHHAHRSLTNHTMAGVSFGEYGKHGKCQSANTGQVNEAALCPWHYVINHDHDRYPESFAEAHRDLESCPYCTGQMRSAVACTKVPYNVPALYRSNICDDEGYYLYKEGWQALIISYACVHVPVG